MLDEWNAVERIVGHRTLVYQSVGSDTVSSSPYSQWCVNAAPTAAPRIAKQARLLTVHDLVLHSSLCPTNVQGVKSLAI